MDEMWNLCNIGYSVFRDFVLDFFFFIVVLVLVFFLVLCWDVFRDEVIVVCGLIVYDVWIEFLRVVKYIYECFFCYL